MIQITAEWNVSLIAAEWPEVRLVYFDDHSTDGTAEFLKEFAQQHPYVQVIENPENYGPYRNYPLNISHCFSNYIWGIGDDDLIEPGVLKRLKEILQLDRFSYLSVGRRMDNPPTFSGELFVFETLFEMIQAFSFNHRMGHTATGIIHKRLYQQQFLKRLYLNEPFPLLDANFATLLPIALMEPAAFLDYPATREFLSTDAKNSFYESDRSIFSFKLHEAIIRSVFYLRRQLTPFPRAIRNSFFQFDGRYLWDVLLEHALVALNAPTLPPSSEWLTALEEIIPFLQDRDLAVLLSHISSQLRMLLPPSS